MDDSQVEEKIRDRIYEALHTPVINKLRAIGLRTSAVLISKESTPDSIRGELASVDSQLRKIIREIRRTVAPSYFKDYLAEMGIGIDENFSSDWMNMLRDAEEQYRFDIDLNYDENELKFFSPNQYLPILDIMGNWLDNIGVHAHAGKVLVDLRTDDDRDPHYLTLSITNDGIGSNHLNDIHTYIHAIPQNKLGLRKIIDAVSRLGATLNCSSSPSTGTTLMIDSIPILKSPRSGITNQQE